MSRGAFGSAAKLRRLFDGCAQRLVKGSQHRTHALPCELGHEIGEPDYVEWIKTTTCRLPQERHRTAGPGVAHAQWAGHGGRRAMAKIAVFLIAQLAAVVYDPYPGPSVALHS
jgi:hypothetical protein